MSQVISQDDIKRLGTIAGIWAHPDDDTFSMAGIMTTAARNGQTVVCITATRGEAGSLDEKRWPPENMADIRTAEMQTALKILGVWNHHWLDYPDGGCAQADEAKAVGRIVDLLKEYRPDSIFSFGPEGMTGHPDHRTVSTWADKAADTAMPNAAVYHAVQDKRLYEDYLRAADEKFNIFFNIDQPPLKRSSECDVCFKLTPEVLELKYEALAAMPSQTEGMLTQTPKEDMMATLGLETFVRVK